MSGFLAGAAAGYRGYSDETRRIADEDRRTKQDQRMDQDAAFQEEMRGRQRTDWKDIDAEKAAEASDRAEIAKAKKQDSSDLLSKVASPVAPTVPAVEAKKEFSLEPKQVFSEQGQSSEPVIPVVSGLTRNASTQNPIALNQKIDLANSTPVQSQNVVSQTAPEVGGMMPKPRNFNTALDDNLEVLSRKLNRGKVSAQEYANTMKMVSAVKTEGVQDALNLMSQGDYSAAIEKFNSVGMRRGAKLLSGQEGVTTINGVQTPTHFVKLRNADGSVTEIDVTKARYQLLDIDKQMGHQDKAANTQMNAEYHRGQLGIAQQNANTQEQYRKDQAENMRMQRDLQLKAMRSAQAPVVKGNNFAEGFDTEKSYDTVLKGIMEANNNAAVSGNKDYVPKTANQMAIEAAQATNKAFQQHISNNQERFIRNSVQAAVPDVKSGKIDFNQWAVAAKQAGFSDAEINSLNPNPPPVAKAQPQAGKVIPEVGGIKQGSTQAIAPNGIDLRSDPVLSTLNSQLKGMNMNDPANTEKIMALGKAKNDRLGQLQEKYGRLTQLITE